MIQFTREYSRAEVAKSQDGLTDVILSIYCNVRAVDGNYATMAGETFPLSSPDPQVFVPFDQITESLVDSWIVQTDQYIKLEEKLTQMIEGMKNPPIVVVPLPFNVPPIVDPVITEANTGN